MKQLTWIVTLLAAISICFVGCKKKDEVDTKKLQSAFKTADNSSQSTVNKAIVAIESADYSEAMTELKKLGAGAKLTPEQEKTVKDVIEQVTKKLGATADKAVGDMQKAMPK